MPKSKQVEILRRRSRRSRTRLEDRRLLEFRMVAPATPEFLEQLGRENPTKKFGVVPAPLYAEGSIHAGPAEKVLALCEAFACCELVA